MIKLFCAFSISILLIMLCTKSSLAQGFSDSSMIENAFRADDFAPVDSMLNSWSLASSRSQNSNGGSDDNKFAHKIYHLFMNDFLAGKLFGKKYAPLNGKYMFVQDTVKYLIIDHLHYLIDSLSFGRVAKNGSLDSLIRKGLFPGMYFRNYIDEEAETEQEKGTMRYIIPDLKRIRIEKRNPKFIFLRKRNQRKMLIHFLGYNVLYSTGQASVRVPTMDGKARKKRIQFLNRGFNLDMDHLLLYFTTVYTPDIFKIIIGKKLDYAFVEYAVRQTGKVYIAFYSDKTIHSGNRPVNRIFYVF